MRSVARVFILALCLLLAPAEASADVCPQQQTFTTAGTYACDVPSYAGAVLVAVAGGNGASGSDGSAQGGVGDLVSAWYVIGAGELITPQSTLDLLVGDDANGRTSVFGGGGPGGNGPETDGGAGGGGSSLTVSGAQLLVAGGGGGGGGGNVSGYTDRDTVYGGGAGGGAGNAGAQGQGEAYLLDGTHPGVRMGGEGGGGADGGLSGGGGLAYASYYDSPLYDWPAGGGGGPNSGGGGGSNTGEILAGGGGGGGGWYGGGGGGGGSNIAGEHEEGDEMGPRSGAGGGGGGSDLIYGESFTVTQGQATSGSGVTTTFATASDVSLQSWDSAPSSCAPVHLFGWVNADTVAGGTMTLSEGGRALGTATPTVDPPDIETGGGVAYDVPLSAGTHTLIATYSGDANIAPGVSYPVIVNVTSCENATTTTIATSDASAPLCSPVTLSSVVTGTSPTGTVTFYDGGGEIGQANVDGSGNASVSVSTLVAGTHSIVASYGGDSTVGGDVKNDSSASAPLTQIVETDGAAATQCFFSYGAGVVASVPVPTDAVSVTITAVGGRGASGGGPGEPFPRGGLGVPVTATIPVGGSGPIPAGGTLGVVVAVDGSGSQATPGGGGAGGQASKYAGGAGGGASIISVGQSPVLVAGGGGGGGGTVLQGSFSLDGLGGSSGQDAWLDFDENPYDEEARYEPEGNGGGGATATGGGKAASTRSLDPFEEEDRGFGSPGAAGGFAVGGIGGTALRGDGGGGGGGGGGGLYGGGGGDPGQRTGGGGGGGSSFVTPTASAQSSNIRDYGEPAVRIEFVSAATASRRPVARAAVVNRPPVLRHVTRSSHCMNVKGTNDARPGAVRVGFRLSKRATVTFRLRRSRRTRIRTQCPALSSVKGPWTTGSTHRLPRRAGRYRQNVQRFHGRLKPGSYRLTMYATDIHGQRSAMKKLRFSVIQ